MNGSTLLVPVLPDGTYPFDGDMLPLWDLAMIEMPPVLEAWFRARLADGSANVRRGVPTEVRFRSSDRGDVAFMVWWPDEEDVLHMLAPVSYRSGSA